MNEKINSLRLDAGISTLENYPRLVVINKNGEVIDPMIGLEKFAELIVLECISIICEDKRIDWNNTINLIDAINDNFGIE